jgi:hypothetical protein
VTAFRLSLAAFAVLCADCAHHAVLNTAEDSKPLFPAVSIPRTLIVAACDKAHVPNLDSHFDGRAILLYQANGTPVAIECGVTVLSGGLSNSSVRVYLEDERARGLRDFLSSLKGVP